MLLIEQTIRLPQEKVLDDDNSNRTIYHSLYTSPNGKLKLLRVVVEEGDSEIVVITVYSTSQIKRYWKGD